jgi:uncharacterized protein (TIGR02271 family)
MYKDQAITDGTMNTQFMEGTPVLDVAGEKIGTVSEYGVQDGFLVIHRGLLNRDAYVPLEVIQITDPSRVYLSITKDAALNQDWQAASMHSDMTAASTGSVAAGPDTLEVPVHEEELVVDRREQEIGRVHLHKDVVEERQTITAPVTHEEVTVERVPGQGEYTPGPDAFIEKDIDVPLMGEELVTDKRARVTEEVRLQKQPVTEEQRVSDTVRKERVWIEGAEEAADPGRLPGTRD